MGPPAIEFFHAFINLPIYHMTGKIPFIIISAGAMATKLDRVVGSNTGLVSKSHNLLITW